MNLTIKSIPEEIYAAIKQQAAGSGRSLNAEIIRILSEAASEHQRRQRMRDSRADLEAFVASQPKLSSSVALVREHKNEHKKDNKNEAKKRH